LPKTNAKSNGFVSIQEIPSLLSVIVPAYNEEAGIEQTIKVIQKVLEDINITYEIIVVDDGSTDSTYSSLRLLCMKHKHLKAIRFSRNFGKESALLAGLELAKGEVIVTIDSDLQHPPTLIPEMIKKWNEGAMIVNAVKRQRAIDSVLARMRASIFNWLLMMLGSIDIRNSSDFKLLDRAIVDILINELKEKGRFYRGLTNWIGFEQACVLFDVEYRNAGKGKWSLLSLAGLAITAIVSFTSAPLRIVTILGGLTMILAVIIAADTLWSWALGTAISGFATTIITLLIIGSFIMISLGIIGEYIAKIYDEIKKRPSYFISESIGLEKTNIRDINNNSESVILHSNSKLDKP